MGLRLITAGESHGRAVLAVVEGIPRGLALTAGEIDRDLERRQAGYGRGGRMAVESDRALIVSGVRRGYTLGSPIALYIRNRDHKNWLGVMSVEERGEEPSRVTRPRPGHGDLAGMLKYGTGDARDVLERTSARETAARTAAGAVARRLLGELGVRVSSRVVSIGDVREEHPGEFGEEAFERAEEDQVRCADRRASGLMVEAIDRAAAEGDTLGGVFEVAVFGMVPGIGSGFQFDRRLDCRLAGGLASIPGVKGVEFGGGFQLSSMRGSEAHDQIFFDEGKGVYRRTNRAGGLEAGMTNGEPLVVRAAMKPIPSLGRPQATVDLATMEPAEAFRERHDVCAVPAAAVVGEAVVAFVLADAVLEKFGGDALDDLRRSLASYLERISGVWKPGGGAVRFEK